MRLCANVRMCCCALCVFVQRIYVETFVKKTVKPSVCVCVNVCCTRSAENTTCWGHAKVFSPTLSQTSTLSHSLIAAMLCDASCVFVFVCECAPHSVPSRTIVCTSFKCLSCEPPLPNASSSVQLQVCHTCAPNVFASNGGPVRSGRWPLLVRTLSF